MWQAIFDETHGKYSYQNSETGHSTWTRPFDYVPRAEDFEEQYDEEMQETIFFDKTTGETMHTRPECLALPQPPTEGSAQTTFNPLNVETRERGDSMAHVKEKLEQRV